MKLLTYPVFLLLIIIITGSCKKIPVINSTNASISFKIDGVPKEAKGIKNVFALYLKQENLMQIIGNIDAAGEQAIGLTINNFHGIGEYIVEDDFLAIYDSPEMDKSVLGTEGKIKITEYIEGKSIKGEFQFKGKLFIISTDPNVDLTETKIFSEGKFEAKITVYTEPLGKP